MIISEKFELTLKLITLSFLPGTSFEKEKTRNGKHLAFRLIIKAITISITLICHSPTKHSNTVPTSSTDKIKGVNNGSILITVKSVFIS